MSSTTLDWEQREASRHRPAYCTCVCVWGGGGGGHILVVRGELVKFTTLPKIKVARMSDYLSLSLGNMIKMPAIRHIVGLFSVKNYPSSLALVGGGGEWSFFSSTRAESLEMRLAMNM